ncbi:MAG TPA: hypothetical protein VHA76_11845 [Solirubrobacterales bacterium]|nr:hypothetical protein [Solirubrobacterales bacterium]
MRTVMVTGPNKVEMVEEPEPIIGPADILAGRLPPPSAAGPSGGGSMASCSRTR